MTPPRKLVIIGGVAGGATAAARARRLCESAEIVVLERGPYPSFANCGMPYHIGGEIADREKLFLQTPASLKARHNLDVRVRSEVIVIDRAARRVTVRRLDDGREYAEPYDKLIISTGAAPIRPPLPGIDHPGRAFLAHALHARYEDESGSKQRKTAGALGLDGDGMKRARAIGQAIRLGYTIAAGRDDVLARTALGAGEKLLTLTVPRTDGTFAGETVTKRLDQLARALELTPRFATRG